MKLGTKIALGFAALIVIAMVLGGISIREMSKVSTESAKLAEEYVPEADLAGALTRRSFRTMYAMRGYGLTLEKVYLDAGEDGLKKIEETMGQLQELDKRQKNLTALKEAMSELGTSISLYEDLKQQTVDLNVVMDKDRDALDTNAKQYVGNCNDFLASQNEQAKNEFNNPEIAANPARLEERLTKITIVNDIIDLGNATRINVFKAQADRDPEVLNKVITENFPKMDKLFDELRKITRLKADLDAIQNTQNAAHGYRDAAQSYLKHWNQLQKVGEGRTKAGDEVVDLATKLSKAAMEQTGSIATGAQAALGMATYIMIVGLVIALIVGIAVAWGITVSITGPINRIIESLNAGAEQVASAAGQISSASQGLAEGSTEQAASLEESSSALEEMASMTRKNADSAQTANEMMEQTKTQVDSGAVAVRNMAQAMGEINDSSEEISKIIKTIEEIAFQTNLLALNAAVEAARAGDAGKGFAVVADEVRNLAQRSAQAARDTADLIEGTVVRVKNGTAIVEELETSFGTIEESASKVADLVAEISAASNEQAQGVDQVNTAVAQMDKVTQQNAANAEESASASEELSAQADAMNTVVNDLVGLVHGASANNGASSGHGGGMYAAHGGGAAKRVATKPAASSHQLTHAGGGGGAGPKVVNPNDVIPLDGDDFSDF